MTTSTHTSRLFVKHATRLNRVNVNNLTRRWFKLNLDAVNNKPSNTKLPHELHILSDVLFGSAVDKGRGHAGSVPQVTVK
jgi:hypothetical protein